MCSIPCRVSCFASVDLKEKGEFNSFFKIDLLDSTVSSKLTKAKQLARQGNEQNLPPKQTATTFALSSNSIILLLPLAVLFLIILREKMLSIIVIWALTIFSV